MEIVVLFFIKIVLSCLAYAVHGSPYYTVLEVFLVVARTLMHIICNQARALHAML